jgi:uncharacterized protein YggE
MRRLLSAAALSLAACATLSESALADTTQPRSITVNGNATRQIAQSSSQAAVDATYRATINDAINAAQLKAASVAGKFGATLGPVLTFTESYGDASCPDSNQTAPAAPIDGAGRGSSNASSSKGGVLRLPPVKRHKRSQGRHGHGKAGHAADQNPICTISSAITVSYQIS